MDSQPLCRDHAADIIHNEFRKVARSDFSAIRDTLLFLKGRLLPRLEDDPERLALERYIAHSLFSTAVAQDCAPDICREWFDEHNRLGYSDAYQKSGVYSIFAQYCSEHGLTEEATTILHTITAELSKVRTQYDWVELELSRLERLRAEIAQ